MTSAKLCVIIKRFKNMKKTQDIAKKLKIKLLILLGAILILLATGLVSYELYLHGIENKVYTNNYTTSVLFSDSLVASSGAAPLALFSLNFFFCRSLIKKWARLIKRKFS